MYAQNKASPEAGCKHQPRSVSSDRNISLILGNINTVKVVRRLSSIYWLMKASGDPSDVISDRSKRSRITDVP